MAFTNQTTECFEIITALHFELVVLTVCDIESVEVLSVGLEFAPDSSDCFPRVNSSDDPCRLAGRPVGEVVGQVSQPGVAGCQLVRDGVRCFTLLITRIIDLTGLT